MKFLKNLYRLMLGFPPDIRDWTWKCHICKKERPNDKISVHQNTTEFYGGEMTENIRYCNDNNDCAEKAKSHRHLKTT
jgi:hypothetical protein